RRIVPQLRHRQRRRASAQGADAIDLRFFVRIVHQRQHVDLVAAVDERANGVKRTDAIPAIRRVGQTVGQEEHSHAGTVPRSSRRRTTCAGTPAAITLSGSGRVTTAPAPTIVSRPTSARTIAPLPIHAPAPMRTIRAVPGWSLMGMPTAVPWVCGPLGMCTPA